MIIVLRVKKTGRVIKSLSVISQFAYDDAKAFLNRQMDGWERSDQYIGQPLEVVAIPSVPGEKLV